MRLVNHTDLDTAMIRQIIAAVRPPGLAGFDVRVSNRSRGRQGHAGTAYHKGSGYHARACPFIVVRIAQTEVLARECRTKENQRSGYLPHILGSRLEGLVFVLAHELRHLWQARVTHGHRVYGARGQFSERDADAYALQMLRRFRRSELYIKSGRTP